jgi:hypothetical protein
VDNNQRFAKSWRREQVRKFNACMIFDFIAVIPHLSCCRDPEMTIKAILNSGHP